MLMGLLRKKQVDSVDHLSRDKGHRQLAKKLSLLDLVAIGKIIKSPTFLPFSNFR